jgi:hypothetical protein
VLTAIGRAFIGKSAADADVAMETTPNTPTKSFFMISPRLSASLMEKLSGFGHKCCGRNATSFNYLGGAKLPQTRFQCLGKNHADALRKGQRSRKRKRPGRKTRPFKIHHH